MKTKLGSRRGRAAGFTLVEMMFSITIAMLAMAMALSTFLFALRTMYKDTQRLASNAALRSFMAQISNETIDASYFYIFPYYSTLNGSVNLTTGPAALTQDFDSTDDVYDRWVAHGDCLVLVTKTAEFRSTDIRQIRVYYRVTSSQATLNAEAPIRYYETADTAGGGQGWGEGTSSTSNGHPLSGLATELNSINLSTTPTLGRLINARSYGRAVPSPYTGYTAGDRYPIFSSQSPTQSSTNGFISINIEFVNGSNVGTNRLLSSSSFNYTISPRK